MKKNIFTILLIVFSISCTNERISYYNPYLPDMAVNLSINLNLPAYAALNYANQSVLETSQGYNGIIIHNAGIGFSAFEATCSNHVINSQSALKVNGQIAKCNHCNREYFLLNGQPTDNGIPSTYGLKPYRVVQSGNMLTVTNL